MTEGNLVAKECDEGIVETEFSSPLKQEPFVLLSANDDVDSAPNSRCNSIGSGKSIEYDSIIANAYEDELKGKCLGEQVMFLKERGWTFRLISDRLNIPMTNCYTAIKKLQLPDEYWNKIKAEVKLKRKAKEAIENHLASKIFANISTIPRKRRMHGSPPQMDDGINETSKNQNCCATNECLANNADRFHISSDPTSSIEHMSLSGRKHLTLEDGKIVQYWRDKGLTLQKIADKLKMPISSCYRAMKRYQVSEKEVLLMGSENQVYETSPYSATEESRICPKSTCELLLGMVDASVHTDGKTNENISSASILSPESQSHKDERLITKGWKPTKTLNQNSWSSNPGCHFTLCGVEINPATVQTIAQHTTASLNGSNRKEKSKTEQIFINTDKQSKPNVPRSDSSNHFSFNAPLDTYYNIATTIKDKLEWASARIAPSTDTEEIVGLMKVVSHGISILKQFDN